jgi:hypothetical protein
MALRVPGGKGGTGMTEYPAGIMTTWSRDLVKEKGGLLIFLRRFESVMQREDAIWLQKSRNKPRYDILYVYIIVCNRVYYRLRYAGHETGETGICDMTASWSSYRTVRWPRLMLSGPYVKAPYKITQRGFQGFRYCSELF